MKKVIIIIAFDTNFGIGKNNTIPWNIKEDLTNFREITTFTKDENRQNTIIMGRKTWESLPYKPLKNRKNVIISKTLKGTNIYESIEEAIIQSEEGENIYIIGGKGIYEECLRKNIVKGAHISKISGNYECDVMIDKDLIYKEGYQKILEKNNTNFIYEYITYI